jgi:hypothetical protein
LKESCPSKTGPTNDDGVRQKFFFLKSFPSQKRNVESNKSGAHCQRENLNKKSQNETHNHTHTPKGPKGEKRVREEKKEKDVLSLSLSRLLLLLLLFWAST